MPREVRGNASFRGQPVQALQAAPSQEMARESDKEAPAIITITEASASTAVAVRSASLAHTARGAAAVSGYARTHLQTMPYLISFCMATS